VTIGELAYKLGCSLKAYLEVREHAPAVTVAMDNQRQQSTRNTFTLKPEHPLYHYWVLTDLEQLITRITIIGVVHVYGGQYQPILHLRKV
jgi:hypothetical protein